MSIERSDVETAMVRITELEKENKVLKSKVDYLQNRIAEDHREIEKYKFTLNYVREMHAPRRITDE
jgi:transposase-like protein